MTAIYPYLTFENAKEAMAYYEQDFGAQITYHEDLTKEQAESASTAKAAATLSFLALVLFIFDIF